MPAKLNIQVGARFGRWTIISEKTPEDSHKRRFLCRCDCGTVSNVQLSHMIQGVSMSCGCWSKEKSVIQATKHGYAGQRIYYIWKDMMRRCYNKKHKRFKDWGGRGITVCPQWHEIQVFVEWSKTSGYYPGLLIERIDNNGNYCPENCTWTTMKKQGNNRRNNVFISHKGKTLTVAEWGELLGLGRQVIYDRLKRGWSTDKVLETPLKTQHSCRGDHG